MIKMIYETKSADLVVTETEFASESFKGVLQDSGIPRPTLGFNAVGGRSSTAIHKALQEGGCMVTYGGMSMKPVTLPTGLLIFKDIRAVGFWLSRWVKNSSRAERQKMLDQIGQWMAEGKVAGYFEKIPFSEFQRAVLTARMPYKPAKVLLTF
jgi:trans-2-enoyl-CoA reductase